MKTSLPKYFSILMFALLFAVTVFTGRWVHSNNGYFNWKSELWADRAGYYIYLPATFYYHWDLKQAPEKMDEKTGWGFYYVQGSNKIRTTYNYPVALLVSPFFVAVHYITKIFHIQQDWAFAPIYHKMLNVAAAFYAILGLWLLTRFLKKYYSETTSLIASFFIFAGTNLFYYTVDDSMMSHVYTFFLVSLMLLSLKNYLDQSKKPGYFILFAVTFAMTVLIRPSNFILVFVPFLLDVASVSDLKKRFLFWFKPLPIAGFLIICFLVLLPQMIYWKYLTGSYITSYNEQRGFYNLLSPRLPELWFSTLNGLFLYTPLFFLILAGMYLMIKRRATSAWLFVGIFFLLSYILSSWWSWYYGCSFGQRSFIDFLPLFAVPFGFLIEEKVQSAKKLALGLLVVLMFLFSYYNIKLTLHYQECFFGSTWDWSEFSRQLHRSGLWPVKTAYSYSNDFENAAMVYNANTVRTVARSGDVSAAFDAQHVFTDLFFNYPGNLVTEKKLSRISMKLWVFKNSESPTGAVVVCEAKKDGQIAYYMERPLDVPMAAIRKWYAVPLSFDIPETLDPWSELKIFLWNKNKSSFFIDDVNLKFEKTADD